MEGEAQLLYCRAQPTGQHCSIPRSPPRSRPPRLDRSEAAVSMTTMVCIDIPPGWPVGPGGGHEHHTSVDINVEFKSPPLPKMPISDAPPPHPANACIRPSRRFRPPLPHRRPRAPPEPAFPDGPTKFKTLRAAALAKGIGAGAGRGGLRDPCGRRGGWGGGRLTCSPGAASQCTTRTFEPDFEDAIIAPHMRQKNLCFFFGCSFWNWQRQA